MTCEWSSFGVICVKVWPQGSAPLKHWGARGFHPGPCHTTALRMREGSPPSGPEPRQSKLTPAFQNPHVSDVWWVWTPGSMPALECAGLYLLPRTCSLSLSWKIAPFYSNSLLLPRKGLFFYLQSDREGEVFWGDICEQSQHCRCFQHHAHLSVV